MAEITVGNTTFKYAEKSFGTNRGISIWRPGVANDKHTYKLSPDPHDDRWYNTNQAEFYRQLAERIGTSFNGNNQTWPAFGSKVTVHDEEYTLNER